MIYFQQLFPDNRQTGDSQLRKAQLVMLRILKIVDYLCQEYQIRYWLDGGTLLGAVRHQGFIPWDDDVDLVMPRADFNRFIEIASELLPEDLFLQKYKLKKGGYASHGIPPLKIVDKYSRITTNEERGSGFEKGLFIDVIPVDKFGKGAFKQYRFKDYLLKRSYRYLCGHYNNPFDYKQPTKGFFRRFTSRLIKGLPLEKMLAQSANMLERRTHYNKRLKKNYWIGYCLEVPWIRLWEPDAIFPLQKIEFEEAYFPIPNNYDSVLKKFYGDYMTLPPVEKRTSPHLKVIEIDTRKKG